MKIDKLFIYRIFVLFFIVISISSQLHAQTIKTWDRGAATDLWRDGANWNPDGVPTSSDDVIIESSPGIVSLFQSDVGYARTVTIGGSIGGELQLGGEARLYIYQNNGTALTVHANGKLNVNVNDAIRFDPNGINDYDPDLTYFDLQSTTYYSFDDGFIPVDTYGIMNIFTNGTLGTRGSGTFIINNQINNYSPLGTGIFIASHPFICNFGYFISNGMVNFTQGLTVNGTDEDASSFFLRGGTLSGNITVNCMKTFIDHATCEGTLVYNGSTPQYIKEDAYEVSGQPQVDIGIINNLIIQNSNGLILEWPIQVNNELTLTNGIINSVNKTIVLGPGATVSGGSDNSFIYGPCARIVSTGVDEMYPVGDTYYRPVIANLSGSNPVVSFEVFDLSPVPNFVDPIRVLSRVRYWYGSIDSGAVSGGTVTLTYGADDGVQVPGDVRVAYSREEGQWAYRNISGDTGGSSGQVTGTLPADSLGYFTLGSVTFDNSLPVRVVSFTAQGEMDRIILRWETASEVNNKGFEIYRSEGESGEYRRLNGELIMGRGNSHQLERYEYADKEVERGEMYYYRLYSQDFDGTRHEYGEVVWAEVRGIAGGFRLRPNYPNPFNPVTRISFSVGSESVVNVEVYDVVGRRVRVIMDGERMVAGEYDGILWDGRDDGGEAVANGIYYLVFTVREQGIRQVQKMILMK